LRLCHTKYVVEPPYVEVTLDVDGEYLSEGIEDEAVQDEPQRAIRDRRPPAWLADFYTLD